MNIPASLASALQIFGLLAALKIGLIFLGSSSSSSSSLLFDIVHEKTKEHKSITVQKDVKEHQITVRFLSQGAPFNLTKF